MPIKKRVVTKTTRTYVVTRRVQGEDDVEFRYSTQAISVENNEPTTEEATQTPQNQQLPSPIPLPPVPEHSKPDTSNENERKKEEENKKPENRRIPSPRPSPPDPEHFQPDSKKKTSIENKNALDPNRKDRGDSEASTSSSVGNDTLESTRKRFYGQKKLEKVDKRVPLPGARQVLASKRKFNESCSDSEILIENKRMHYDEDKNTSHDENSDDEKSSSSD